VSSSYPILSKASKIDEAKLKDLKFIVRGAFLCKYRGM
jgi:hypothetical protein